jgi:uncharacterized protein (DUF885 family)
LGDRRFDDKLTDITPQGRARVEGEYESFLQTALAIPEHGLSVADQVTRTALIIDLQAELDHLRCHLEEWTVDPLGGPQVEFLNVESYQPVHTPAEGGMMTKRWRAMGRYLDDHVANLQRGLDVDKVAIRACVEKVIEEIKDLDGKPSSEWALLRPLNVPHEDWSVQQREEFRKELESAVAESVRPAFQRYLNFLETKLLPHSRPQDRPGIMHVQGGLESYRRLIHVYTSLNRSPEEIHRVGLDEVKRINQEMTALGGKVLRTQDRKEILARLRTDAALFFATRDEVAEKAESALSRAKSAIPKWFGRLPKADCDVVRMEEHEEKHSTIAYYRQPAADGSRPGQFYVNTSAPETRPRYEAEVLAYHESIPGHHLQIAIAQELEGIPEFRKHSGVTAFVEGWGLYSERLAEEMGLYSSDLDRIGVLSFDAWRACRLVVDTGMHAMGWTRQQAIDFMVENTALAENNIVNEVDRYITWPAQALAYKLGQLEILRLREEAKHSLGDEFRIQQFHDAVLSDGAVALETLKQIVKGHIAEALAN